MFMNKNVHKIITFEVFYFLIQHFDVMIKKKLQNKRCYPCDCYNQTRIHRRSPLPQCILK